MAIHDEVAIDCLLILADPSLYQGRILERRKAPAQVFARPLKACIADAPFTVSRIELRATRVVGHLEAAVLIARDSIHERLAMISPDRESILVEAKVAGRRAEEKHILLGGLNV